MNYSPLLSVALLVLLAPAGNGEVASPEELAVYKILFMGTASPVVIAKSDPEAKLHQLNAKEQSEYDAWLKQHLPGVEDATIADYARCSTTPALLTPKSNVGVHLVFVEQRTLDSFWLQTGLDDARRHLTIDDYRKHPEESPLFRFQKRFAAKDFVCVSRVGFNPGRTQALVDWFNSSDEEVETILLEKQNGKWVIINSVLDAAG